MKVPSYSVKAGVVAPAFSFTAAKPAFELADIPGPATARTARLLSALVLAATLALGCKPEPATSDAPSAAMQPVTGAFGFQLGDPLDSSYRLHTNDDGEISYTADLAEDQKPFRSVLVMVTDERQICSIDARIGRMGRDERLSFQKTLLASLRDKYGLQHGSQTPGKSIEDTTIRFGTAARSVVLSAYGDGLNVTYVDQNLDQTRRAAQEAQRSRTAKGL